MKRIVLIFAFVAITTAQNPRKVGKHGKHNGGGGGGGAYIASSPGSSGGGDYGSSQYESPVPYSSNQGGYKPQHNTNEKPAYAQLVQDTRTLNHDGTINFNFQADNGLQQGETVDPDGTRRGFYSYPGADGKPITVKYTAGKNGFIAEGDHLPLQPQAAAHSDAKQESGEYSPKGKKSYNVGGGGGGLSRQERYNSGQYYPEDHESGQYNPESDESSGPQYNPQPAAPSYHGGRGGGGSSSGQYKRPSPPSYNGPSHSPNHNRYQGGGGGGPASYNSYSSPTNSYSSGASEFVGFGGDYPQSAPQTTHKHYAPAGVAPARGPPRSHSPGRYSGGPSPNFGGHSPSYSPGPSSHRGGGGFTADNPYTPAGAGPYNGNFDLGNSGHFSINFTPGSEQEYNPGGHQGSPSNAVYAQPRRPRPRGPQRGQY